MLKIYHQLPQGFLDLEPKDLYDFLGGPCLIHLAGKNPQEIFISVLQHGNEDTGFYALQTLLKQYQQGLPRALTLFIGNVSAAKFGLRRLESQPDYNRQWPDPDYPNQAISSHPEADMMLQICQIMQQRSLFMSIDLHNNTGSNPHYACINKLEPEFIALASLFSETLVYFTYPRGVQSLAFSDSCPAVTLECGQVGELFGQDHVCAYLKRCLELEIIPSKAHGQIRVLHTIAQVKIPDSISIGFGYEPADICFADDLDQLNFQELPANTTLAHLNTTEKLPFDIFDTYGQAIKQSYFFVDADNTLKTSINLIPAMLTRNKKVIYQDCLCYIMERYPLPE